MTVSVPVSLATNSLPLSPVIGGEQVSAINDMDQGIEKGKLVVCCQTFTDVMQKQVPGAQTQHVDHPTDCCLCE